MYNYFDRFANRVKHYDEQERDYLRVLFKFEAAIPPSTHFSGSLFIFLFFRKFAQNEPEFKSV